jgi:hypothetical protein
MSEVIQDKEGQDIIREGVQGALEIMAQVEHRFPDGVPVDEEGKQTLIMMHRTHVINLAIATIELAQLHNPKLLDECAAEVRVRAEKMLQAITEKMVQQEANEAKANGEVH